MKKREVLGFSMHRVPGIYCSMKKREVLGFFVYMVPGIYFSMKKREVLRFFMYIYSTWDILLHDKEGGIEVLHIECT